MKKRIRLLSIAVQIDDFPKKSSETRGIARPQSTQVQIIVTRGLFYNIFHLKDRFRLVI